MRRKPTLSIEIAGITIIVVLLISGLILSAYLNFKNRESPIPLEGDVRETRQFPNFSDFLRAYSETNQSEKDKVITAFLEEQEPYGFPMTNMTHATFIYLGSPTTQTVLVAGDFTNWGGNPLALQRLEDSNLFYLTLEFESDARLDYKFIVDGQWILDPLNDKTVIGGFGPNNELAMPEYIQPEEIRYVPDIPHGKIEYHEDIYSPQLSNSRTIAVYLPPEYDETKQYPTIYVHDGSEFISLANMTNVLDYLIWKGNITPVIAVFIPPVSGEERISEYNPNEKFAEFISTNVVSFIDSTYSTIQSPESRAMMGVSLGALISAYIGYTRSEIFGNIASMSGAYWYNGTIILQTQSGEKKNLNWYVDWGTYEKEIMDGSKQLVQALKNKNYDYVTREWHEGHSWGSWRAHIDEVLVYFFPA